MQGVASILDEQHTGTVEALWDELERQFGLKYACVAYPHFSYQVVERYDVMSLEPVLRSIAQNAQPMLVRTSGLGIFTGERPVLYVRVVRDPLLSAFHQVVWDAISPYTTGNHAHYAPANWIPHITLAMQDLTHEALPEVIRLLSRRSFTWEITVDSLSLVLDAQGQRDAWLHFKFGADS